MSNRARKVIQDSLAQANIGINRTYSEPHPWDIEVHDERFYNRVLSQGSMGLGEAYMDGWWDCAHIDQLIDRVQTCDVQTCNSQKCFTYGFRTWKSRG